MKRLTTIVCSICFMIAGIALAIYEPNTHGNEIQASPLVWNIPKGNVIPLDLQLDLEKRQSNNVPVKDSINIQDSIRYIYKVKYVYRPKPEDSDKCVAARTTARNVGQHLAAVTPDSLPMNPALTGTPDREEQPGETVVTSKATSIQLTVDGNVVYSTDDNHSTEGGQ